MKKWVNLEKEHMVLFIKLEVKLLLIQIYKQMKFSH